MEQKLFSVLPMSQRFSLEAGHTYTGSITISNSINASSDFAYIVSVAPYSIIGDNYATDFVTTNSYTAITDWITIDEPTGVLAPNQHQSVNFTITVPDNAPAGGQYAAIVVSENPNNTVTEEGATISSVLQLASVIYADVSGITTKDGRILDNYIPGFSLDDHITISTTIENNGNVHEDAIIVVEVANLITGATIFPIAEENDKFQEIIMPESSRYITRTIDNLPPLSVLKVSQTVYFNDTVSKREQTLILCPLWFIFFTLAAIASIIAIFIARHHHRRRNQFLL